MSGATQTTGALVAACTGYFSTRVSAKFLRSLELGGPGLWERTNHRGEPINLQAGPSLAIGLVDATVTGHLTASRDGRAALGHAIAAAGAGAFGLIDDLAEDRGEPIKGLRGHLGALRKGRLTTGAVKVLGIGATGVASAAVLTRRSSSATAYVADLATNTVLIAGGANLINLLDLRPGRALKAGAIGALALFFGHGAATAGSVAGVGLAAIGPDLAETHMLGDCGANSLGATLGAGAVQAPRVTRIVVASAIIALTLASERVSFSAVIDRTPALRAIDSWGRRQ